MNKASYCKVTNSQTPSINAKYVRKRSHQCTITKIVYVTHPPPIAIIGYIAIIAIAVAIETIERCYNMTIYTIYMNL